MGSLLSRSLFDTSRKSLMDPLAHRMKRGKSLLRAALQCAAGNTPFRLQSSRDYP